MSRHAVFRWTVGLGQWWGRSVELHLLLLLGIVGVFALAAENVTLGLVIAGVWLASVALHQLAHVAMAFRVGGDVRTVVVGPVGGHCAAELPDEPEPQVLVALAGPAVHLLLAVAAVCGLMFRGPAEVLPLLHPIDAWSEWSLAQPLAAESLGLAIVKVGLWLNWTLFLVNLLPAYPFDGAVMIRTLLWPMTGRRTAYVVTGRLAQVAAVVVMGYGAYLAAVVGTTSGEWLAPVALAVYLAVAAQRDWHTVAQLEHDAYAEDFLPLDADVEEEFWLRDDSNHMVLVEQHYDQLRERYERKRKAQEDYEDARVDDILARLHSEGFEHLSQEDQAFLKRASRRYRDRRRDRGVPES